MNEPSIHDNNIYAYVVHCQQQRIVLHTEYRDGGADKYTDVIFAEVLAHHFECVLPGNVLLGIEEVPPEQIVVEWRELFVRQKNYGWPQIEYTDMQGLISILHQRNIKGFEISSPYGLSGWVLATHMEIRRRDAKQLGS